MQERERRNSGRQEESRQQKLVSTEKARVPFFGPACLFLCQRVSARLTLSPKGQIWLHSEEANLAGVRQASESAGIPEEILVQHPKSCIRIPMWGDMRSLNLSNSAAILLYEAYRQNDFENLEKRGELHRLHW